MWHFGLKCQRIRASVKASHKQLKAVLASGVKNFGPASVMLELVEFPLFDNFFADLAKFRDLDVFSLFNFPDLDNFLDFLACFILFLPTPNPLTSLLPSFFLEADLLSSFLLKANLLLLFLLRAGLLGNLIVFSIEVLCHHYYYQHQIQ